MIKLSINHTKISASNLGKLVEGNINSIFAQFVFSPEWDSLARVAVFTNGDAQKSVLLSSDICAIPYSVLTAPGNLYVSVRGVGDSGSIVICTGDEYLGRVGLSGAGFPVVDLEDVEPDVIDSLLADVAELKANGVGSDTAGADGKSAYEIAVEDGFVGTITEWLASLKGAEGHTPIKGVDYFTAADIAEIINAVIAALPTWEGGSF